MSVLDVLTAARDLPRLQEIAATLIRHGLGDVVTRLGLAGPLERAGRALRWDKAEDLGPMALPLRVRRACEDLGPTFVKLGQLLSTRGDLLGPEWTEELAKLQRDVKAVESDGIRAILVEEWGAEPEEMLGSFEAEPLAAGSIGQVHAATLKDGQAVVVKVRRPGIRARVEADLRLLERLAELVVVELPELRSYRPVALVRQFRRQLRDELDFTVEARHTNAIRKGLEPFPEVLVPQVHEEFTRERVLVLERMEGQSAADWLRQPPEERTPVEGPTLASVGARSFLSMVFEEGLFHADPHPGNILFPGQGRLGLLDCGMVGRLSEERRRELIELLIGLHRADARKVADLLERFSDDPEDLDRDALESDVRAFLGRYHGVDLGEVPAGQALGEVMELVRDHALFLPPDVSALLRLLSLLDGLGSQLDPSFDLLEAARPYVERAVRQHFSPTALFSRHAEEFGSLLLDLPRDVRAILDRARRGRLQVKIHVERLEEAAGRLDRGVNRLVVGVVTAALIVGTSVVLTVESGPKILGLPALGLLGFTSSAAVGFGLLISIWRSGRRR
jgi:ubiquinone biosynthesis protein